MAKSKKLVIFDGNAIIHRSFHAVPQSLITSKGELVNAVYGFASLLLKVMKELKPDYVAVAFDLKGPTFRHKQYKEYKATRVKAPQELYDQIERVHEVVEAFNIPIYELEGYEADDVIGTVTKKVDGDIEKTIVTGDMDTLQLVDTHTKVYTLKKSINDTILYDPAAVKERYGLTPDQMIDYKALRGDPSDNIPGVKGIGEKTAVELLEQFKTLDDLYAAIKKNTPKAQKLKERTRELLTEHERDALMSRELATIVRDAPVKFSLDDTSVQQYNRAQVMKLFQELEFKSLLGRLPEDGNGEERRTEARSTHGKTFDYELINDESSFKSFLAAAEKAPLLCIDTETTSLDERSAQLLGISVAWQEGTAYYLNVRDHKEWLKELKGLFENTSIPKYGHNLKYDWQILKRHGIDLQPLTFDSMIAAYLLSAGRRAYGLKELALTELGYEMQPIEDLIGPKGKDQLTMDKVPVEKVSWYAAEDADWTLRLASKFDTELEKENIKGLFEKIEMPLVPVLGRMELAGIKVDVAFLKKMEKSLKQTLAGVEKKIYKHAGSEFNIGSPIQLKKVLFDNLEISTQGLSRTKTGVSTAAGELEKLEKVHPIIPLIMEWREISKLLSTYVTALPKQVHDQTGRVHTTYSQTIAATGRLSSIDPNLQNIPIRTELGREIRKAFIADKGNVLISADYSQIELRVIASLANDQRMIESFKAGEDIHKRTAADIHNVSLDEVTPEMRYAAKEINFGIIYGMGVYGLASRTGIDREAARDFIQRYYDTHEAIADWLEETRRMAYEQGYVETLFGRRRQLPDIHSHNRQIRAAAERVAVNMPIQGTAADLIKMAMIKIDAELPKKFPNAKMLLQVHDELVFEVPEKEAPAVSQYIKDAMENVYQLRVPVEVHIGTGSNWGECK